MNSFTITKPLSIPVLNKKKVGKSGKYLIIKKDTSTYFHSIILLLDFMLKILKNWEGRHSLLDVRQQKENLCDFCDLIEFHKISSAGRSSHTYVYIRCGKEICSSIFFRYGKIKYVTHETLKWALYYNIIITSKS